MQVDGAQIKPLVDVQKPGWKTCHVHRAEIPLWNVCGLNSFLYHKTQNHNTAQEGISTGRNLIVHKSRTAAATAKNDLSKGILEALIQLGQ